MQVGGEPADRGEPFTASAGDRVQLMAERAALLAVVISGPGWLRDPGR